MRAKRRYLGEPPQFIARRQSSGHARSLVRPVSVENATGFRRFLNGHAPRARDAIGDRTCDSDAKNAMRKVSDDRAHTDETPSVKLGKWRADMERSEGSASPNPQ